MVKKGFFLLFLVVFCMFLIICGFTLLMGGAYIPEEENAYSLLEVPSREEVLNKGYPKNERGETYGPDIGEWIDRSPDLVLVENKEGVLGYVRKKELDGNPPISTEEASEHISMVSYVSMYLQDGFTEIGKFEILS